MPGWPAGVKQEDKSHRQLSRRIRLDSGLQQLPPVEVVVQHLHLHAKASAHPEHTLAGQLSSQN